MRRKYEADGRGDGETRRRSRKNQSRHSDSHIRYQQTQVIHTENSEVQCLKENVPIPYSDVSFLFNKILFRVICFLYILGMGSGIL